MAPVQDHDVYKKRLRADGSPIDEGTKHDIGPETLAEASDVMKTENGTICGSCYGAQTAAQQCCNTCDEVCAIIRTQLAGASCEEQLAVSTLERSSAIISMTSCMCLSGP